MTVPLSPHKVSKILRGYFRGFPQTKIAKEAGVDQSSISHYASGFKEMAAEYSLLAAGKEYQVMNEVESLRSLSVELYKSKLTVDEARQGHNIIKAFLKLGIGPDQHRPTRVESRRGKRMGKILCSTGQPLGEWLYRII